MEPVSEQKSQLGCQNVTQLNFNKYLYGLWNVDLLQCGRLFPVVILSLE